MFIRVFIFSIIGLSCISIQAQQLPQTAHFMYNQLIYNPAAAGMYETEFNANIASRFQWGGGAEGGPTSHMFWSDYRFSGNRMAVGMNINIDKFGATNNLEVSGNYSYYVPLSNKIKLAMGLRLGVNSTRFDASGLTAWDSDDPVIQSLDARTTSPKVGTGFQLLTKNFYAGIAIPTLILGDKNNIYGNKDRSFFQKRRNYIIMSGYKLKINDTYDIYPNLRMIYYPGSDLRVDLNTIFEITDYFWFGATYSTSSNHSLMAGTHISSRIRFAYAYEFNTRSSIDIPLSTHEINVMLNLDDLFRK